MIRTTTSSDEKSIIAVATASGLFEANQTEELAEMLSAFHQAEDSKEIWLVAESDNEIVGIAYLAPEKMTEGTWNLYLIAVHPDHQRKGVGKELLEDVVRRLSGQRVLLVETAGTDDFDYVREFYLGNGFEKEARIREFYSAGVDKVVYRKVL